MYFLNQIWQRSLPASGQSDCHYFGSKEGERHQNFDLSLVVKIITIQSSRKSNKAKLYNLQLGHFRVFLFVWMVGNSLQKNNIFREIIGTQLCCWYWHMFFDIVVLSTHWICRAYVCLVGLFGTSVATFLFLWEMFWKSWLTVWWHQMQHFRSLVNHRRLKMHQESLILSYLILWKRLTSHGPNFEVGYMQTIYFQKEADCVNLFVSPNKLCVGQFVTLLFSNAYRRYHCFFSKSDVATFISRYTSNSFILMEARQSDSDRVLARDAITSKNTR